MSRRMAWAAFKLSLRLSVLATMYLIATLIKWKVKNV